MTFDPTKPGPNDLLSQSQVDLQSNFAVSNTVFSNDHVAFNILLDPGKHKQIYFNTNNVPAAPAGTQSIIYTNGATPVPYHVNSAFTSEFGRVWARLQFDGTFGGMGPIFPAATQHYNVASYQRVGATGDYQINFTVALPTATYLILGTTANSGPNTGLVTISARNTNWVQINTYNPNGPPFLVNNADINILIIGN